MTDNRDQVGRRRKKVIPPRTSNKELPAHLFFKVYIRDFIRMVQSKQLTANEIAALFALATHMDADGVCYPSKQRLAVVLGKRSPKWIMKILRRLREKGVISFEDQANQSHLFTLPPFLAFGGNKSTPAGDRNLPPTGDTNQPSLPGQNSNREGGLNTAPELESVGTKTKNITRESKNNHSDTSTKNDDWRSQMPPLGTIDQRSLARILKAEGIAEPEAYLMSLQFNREEIDAAIIVVRPRLNGVENPGGYLRRTLENNTGRKLIYPSVQSQNLALFAREQFAAMDRRNMYTDDPYFARRDDLDDTRTDDDPGDYLESGLDPDPVA